MDDQSRDDRSPAVEVLDLGVAAAEETAARRARRAARRRARQAMEQIALAEGAAAAKARVTQPTTEDLIDEKPDLSGAKAQSPRAEAPQERAKPDADADDDERDVEDGDRRAQPKARPKQMSAADWAARTGAGPSAAQTERPAPAAGDPPRGRAEPAGDPDDERGGRGAKAARTETDADAATEAKGKLPAAKGRGKDAPQKGAAQQGGGALAQITPMKAPAAKAKGGAVADALPDDALEVARAAREGRMRDIRRELRRRRRFRALGIMLRFAVFVLIPTAFVGWYYYERATDMYVSESAMVFKGGAGTSTGGGVLGSLLAGTPTDSIALQDYMKSRDILERLQAEHGWIDHFQSEEIDWWHRLPADASLDDAYSYLQGQIFKSGKVAVSYDPLEGIVRLEVTGATPQAAKRFAEAIISYGEELINNLNDRARNNGIRLAEAKVAEAREALRESQRQVAVVQEQLNIFSVESEAGALQSRITMLEAEIDEIVAEIARLRTVTSNDADSRFTPLRTNLEIKSSQLSQLRSKLTGGGAMELDGPSMAQLSASLELARVDQSTAQMLYASALTSQEAAIAAASEQSLFLETVVRPSLADKASKPERLQNTALVFLVLFAAYIIGLLTLSLIREQAAI